MKKRSPLLFVLLLVASCAVFISCKKNNTVAAVAQCRITDIRMNTYDSTQLHLEYDSAKRLKSITTTPSYIYGTKFFIYSGNLIYISTDSGKGKMGEVDTISLTPSGKIATVIQFWSNSLPIIDSMTYDSHDQLIKLIEINGPIRSEATYTWDNGDAISRDGQKFLNSISFSYYADKKAADGDFYNIQELLTWGAHALCSKHLMKKDLDGDISYTFDKDGKITTATVGYGATKDVVYTYSYTCD